MRMNQLHVAAYDADGHRVGELVRSGADPNERDERGYTPLLWAAFRGAVANQGPVVAALVGAGADVNATTAAGDSTVLMLAVHSGNLALVRSLVGYGANVNLPADEVTPLMVAARSGAEEMSRLLLELGASAHVRTGRFTASDYARHGGHDDLARILEEACDVSA
jgi:ankyrin repeat protein